MNKMELYVNMMVIVMIGTCGVSVAQMYTPTTFEMFEECDNKIIISEDMLLQLSVNKTRRKTHTCSTTVESDVDGNRLLLRFLNMNISDRPGCLKARISLYETEGKHPSVNFCGNMSIPVFNSSGQSVRVKYETSRQDEDAAHDVFTLLISSFHEQVKGECTSYDFTCSNSLCIDSDMTCNNYDDCSDNSDETIGCSTTDGDQLMKKIVIVSVACGMFLFAVVCVFAFKIHRARNRRGAYLSVD
ncbi:low-density lipoprotein receptor-related protein 12-like [Haliotis rubra]|uniref:low-density lipoprotein receptor-related protein 12-like n=1 Tax=Haliotis rubra TaxID=36100 RepID=UPI001EE5299E|nr:low-density lipoprotein receptor-related protein 12-like [Haliotis rubra]